MSARIEEFASHAVDTYTLDQRRHIPRHTAEQSRPSIKTPAGTRLVDSPLRPGLHQSSSTMSLGIPGRRKKKHRIVNLRKGKESTTTTPTLPSEKPLSLQLQPPPPSPPLPPPHQSISALDRGNYHSSRSVRCHRGYHHHKRRH